MRAVLSIRDFRLLWVGQIASDFGDAVARVALGILATAETHSPWGAGAVLVVLTIPYLGLAQVLTSWAERFNRRHVLVASDLFRAALFLAIAAPAPFGLRLGLLLLASSATPVFHAIRNAITPRIVGDQLGTAVTVQTVTNDTAYVLGLFLGGVLVALIGTESVIAIDAATFLVSAFAISRIAAAPADSDERSVRLRDGWDALRSDWFARRLLLLMPAALAIGFLPESLVAPLVDESLNGSNTVKGVLASVGAASAIVLTALVRADVDARSTLRSMSLLAAFGATAAAALFAFDLSRATAVAAYAAVGFVFAGRAAMGSTLSSRLADHQRAAAFSALEGVVAAVQLVVAVGAGALATVTSTATAMSVTFAGVALLSVVVGFRAPRQPLSSEGQG
jgi:predicted MFS family arabinose efflux permease